ncbi:hypothetical protein ACHAO9_012605 [Fusarium lateritium]
MNLVDHGVDVPDLMRPEIEACVTLRKKDMIRGDLLRELLHDGVIIYTWRADVDKFLGMPGYIKDFSVTKGKARRKIFTTRAAGARAERTQTVIISVSVNTIMYIEQKVRV